MANTLRFKRGLVSGIPTAALGEPLFTTDTFDLYIGNGTGNTRFQKYIASGTTSQLLRGDGSLLTMPIVLTSPSNGQVLKYNGTSWVNDSDAGITGSGTTNYLPKFTGASTLGNSNLQSDANGNLGFQSTPNASALANTLISVRDGSLISSAGTYIHFLTNSYYSTDWKYNVTSLATRYSQEIGSHIWYTAPSGTANATITWTERARITSTGNFIINNASTDNGLRFQVTGDGFFSGSVGIGTSALTGRSLSIAKNMTGSINAWGIQSSGAIQSDVTNNAYYFQSVSSTQATTFSLPRLYHYQATQGTFGAGSSIDSQYGFMAEATLTGATNNYGFFGNIASGTGRWNLYMNGSAANFLAGNLGIGITTPAGNLDVYNATSSSIYNRVGAAGANWATTSTQSQIGTYTNHPLQIKTNDTSRIYITNG